MAGRYVKRKTTKRTGGKLKRAAALHHSNKLAKKVKPQESVSERTARYAKKSKTGRRRTGARKGFGFAKALHDFGQVDVFSWLRADPAKLRENRR